MPPRKVGDTTISRTRKYEGDSLRQRGTKWTLTWHETGELPWPDAPYLLALACDAVMLAHRQAILDGVRANDGSPQPKLSPRGKQGWLARDGERPNIRGNVGELGPNSFPNAMFRGRIRYSTKRIARQPTGQRVFVDGKSKAAKRDVIGVRASTTIEPGKFGIPQWLGREATRDGGIEYLFVDGAVEKAIDDMIMSWLDVVIDGPVDNADARAKADDEVSVKDASDSV